MYVAANIQPGLHMSCMVPWPATLYLVASLTNPTAPLKSSYFLRPSFTPSSINGGHSQVRSSGATAAVRP